MDNEHKFDLALQLGNLPIAYELALEMENEQKWLQLGDVATKNGDFNLVQECLTRAQSFGSLILFASANSDKQLMASIGDQSRKNGQFNIAFLSNFVLGKLDECLDILIENQRLPEAAFFCRTYLPSQISRVIDLWREKLKQMNMERAAQALANPTDYENLFPGLVDTYKTEQYLKQQTKTQSARDFSSITVRPRWMENEWHRLCSSPTGSEIPSRRWKKRKTMNSSSTVQCNRIKAPQTTTTTRTKRRISLMHLNYRQSLKPSQRRWLPLQLRLQQLVN